MSRYTDLSFRLSLLRFLLSPLLCLVTLVCQAESPVFAIAANLTGPMTEIADRFEAETGMAVRLTFGSSGNLSRQIVQGAPYELFISASRSYVDFLESEHAVDEAGIALVQGHIGFYIPDDSILAEYKDIKSITNALSYREYRKIVFANPEYAPYGVAAVQALQSAGLWALETSRTILTDNVAQVTQFALSGNIDLAIIPYAFMLQENVKTRGSFYPIPVNWHEPVLQYMVLLPGASDVSRRFRDYVLDHTAGEIFRKYGYRLADPR